MFCFGNFIILGGFLYNDYPNLPRLIYWDDGNLMIGIVPVKLPCNIWLIIQITNHSKTQQRSHNMPNTWSVLCILAHATSHLEIAMAGGWQYIYIHILLFCKMILENNHSFHVDICLWKSNGYITSFTLCQYTGMELCIMRWSHFMIYLWIASGTIYMCVNTMKEHFLEYYHGVSNCVVLLVK